jgi:hypothetical protein
LPEKLDDMTVPLPADPFTGKSFDYKLDGTTAHIQAGAPKGEATKRYEITIK